MPLPSLNSVHFGIRGGGGVRQNAPRMEQWCLRRGSAAGAPTRRSRVANSLHILGAHNANMTTGRRIDTVLSLLRDLLPSLAEGYGVENLEVFGSYVRDEQGTDSDLDVLVTYREVPTLLGFIALENYLTDLLGVNVDLVMKDSLKPRIGRYILKQAIPV